MTYVSAAIGVWLMAAPAALGGSSLESASLYVAGPLAVALSVAATAPALAPLRKLLLPVGLWLVVAPWFLGSSAAMVTTSVTSGLLLAALAWRAPSRSVQGGGWRAVAPLLWHRPTRIEDARGAE